MTAELSKKVPCSIAEPARRATLIAVSGPEAGLRLAIRPQGKHETVFFDA